MEVWQLFLQRSIHQIIYKLALLAGQAAIRGRPVCYPGLAQQCLCMHQVLLRWRGVTALANCRQRRFLFSSSVLASPPWKQLPVQPLANLTHSLLTGAGNKHRKPSSPSRRNHWAGLILPQTSGEIPGSAAQGALPTAPRAFRHSPSHSPAQARALHAGQAKEE